MSSADRTVPPPPGHLGVVTGTLLVVANIIGVGVFLSIGFMADAMPSPPAILLAWAVGGVAALCGALSYAELGVALPRNGGEYQLLSRMYHPAVGFVGGVVSEVAGFAAPLAAFAAGFEEYLRAVLPGLPKDIPGIALLLLFSVLHSAHVTVGSRFHNAFTLGKLGLIGLFIVAGLSAGDMTRLSEGSTAAFRSSVFSGGFATQLVFVSFAYSGWNATSYLAGEFRRPDRDIVRSVLAGTGIVACLYLGLNAVFLAAAPLAELSGTPETRARAAHIAAQHLFGEGGSRLISLLIALGLISSISGNMLSGSRVLEAMGTDWRPLRILSLRRAEGGPVVALALQASLAIGLFLASGRIDWLMQYVGLTLALSALATVLGVIVLRFREPDLPRPYRTWGYPFTPLLFLVLQGWMIVFEIQRKPGIAAGAAATVAVGLLLYGMVWFAGGGRQSVRNGGV